MFRLLILGGLAVLTMAQGPDKIFFAQRITGPDGPPAEKGNVAFISAEMAFEGKTVTGVPYTAEAVTEMVQTLSDGNHISQKNEGLVARDSQGRTRREQTLGAGLLPAGEAQKIVFINDPVAQVNYVLHPDRTAQKMTPIRGSAPLEAGSYAISTMTAGQIAGGPAGMPPLVASRQVSITSKANIESLGQQTIEGVLAEGKRTTSVIPAGTIGNEKDIQILNETWYSPELQTTISSTRTDPRMGTTTFRLTNIQRAEPSPDLFQVPSDYTVREMPKPEMLEYKPAK